MNLLVNEIFYSIQGEGARAGSANVFIRLQGCQAKHACFASGVRCDTEFESGREMMIPELIRYVKQFNCRNIIWTGGEPAAQLTEEIVAHFAEHFFYQSIETSGLLTVPKNLDWITISPKVAEHVLEKNFNDLPVKISELRYVRHAGQEIPKPALEADHYFISPHSDGDQLNSENLKHCIELVKKHPKWKLSLQMHKIWKVL